MKVQPAAAKPRCFIAAAVLSMKRAFGKVSLPQFTLHVLNPMAGLGNPLEAMAAASCRISRPTPRHIGTNLPAGKHLLVLPVSKTTRPAPGRQLVRAGGNVLPVRAVPCC